MRSRNVVGPLCLLLLAGSAPAPAARLGQAPDLAGRVFDAISGAPVEGANITIPALHFGTASTMDGRFLILGVGRVGEGVELVVRHPCFHTVRVDVSGLDSADPFALGRCRKLGATFPVYIAT
jgi:hypothetical protein